MKKALWFFLGLALGELVPKWFVHAIYMTIILVLVFVHHPLVQFVTP